MEDTVHGLLKGTCASAYPGSWFVCPAAVSAPAGFERQWLGLATEADAEKYFRDEAILDRVGSIVVIAHVTDPRQRSILVSLGSVLGSHPVVSPPVILIPVVPGNHDVALHQLRYEKESVTELTKLSCVDTVVWGMPRGTLLQFQIAAKVRHIETQLSQLQDRMVCRAAQTERAEAAKDAIHGITWQYLRGKCFHAIPRMRHIAEDDQMVGGVLLGPKVSRGPFGIIRLANRPDTNGDRAGETCNVLVLEKNDRVHNFRDMHMINTYLTLMNTVSTTRHPRISNLLGIMHSPMRLCVLMENCGTTTLFTRLRHLDGRDASAKPLTTNKIANLFMQVSEAVSHLHQVAQVCHRDVKPENITIKEEGDSLQLRLGGFELAAHQRPGSKCKMACGTLPFAAPEAIVLVDGGYDGYAADMWSLGVLFLEVSCGLRSVERAVALPSDSAKGSPFKGTTPSIEIANTIRRVFSHANFLENFLLRCRLEAHALRPSVQAAVSQVNRCEPEQRANAEQFMQVLKFMPCIR